MPALRPGSVSFDIFQYQSYSLTHLHQENSRLLIRLLLANGRKNNPHSILSVVEFVAVKGIAEIRLFYEFVADDLGGWTGSDHSTMINNVGLIDNLKSPYNVMVSNKNADTRSDESLNFTL